MRDNEELREPRELRELGTYDAGAPPLDDATRERVRVRLLAAMSAANGTDAKGAANKTRPTPAVRRRPVLRIAVTGAVAAAVAAGVLVAGHGGFNDPGSPSSQSDGVRIDARPTTGSPVMANVSSQTVLKGAAAYARQHEKAASPRDDQFIYTKEITEQTNRTTGVTKAYTDENWRSVDGAKPSWIMEVGKGWWSPPLKAHESVWPPQDWGTLKKLPTDPKKLITYLVRWSSSYQGKDGSFKGITDEQWSTVHFSLAGLLELVPVMPEGLRPAAYEALGMIPGVKVVPNQQDAGGRTGVAVTYDDPTLPPGEVGTADYLIFDPKTYEFLGYRTEHTSGKGKDKVTITQFSYLDSWAVVDKAKQRP